MKKIIYYNSLTDDDFACNNIKYLGLPANYNYYPKVKLFRFTANILSYFIAVPIVDLALSVYLHKKIINKRKLKMVDGAYFIYANHTNGFLDAGIPALSNRRRKPYIVANSDCVNIKGLRNVVKMLGGLPLPDTLDETKRVKKRMDEIISENGVVSIYPEAHIWPYYNDIRPFSNVSFKYPSKYNTPIFTVTNCYKKRLIGKRPRVISVIDGPFYPQVNKTVNENSLYLRDICYNTMKKRVSEYSTYSYITYIKKAN